MEQEEIVLLYLHSCISNQYRADAENAEGKSGERFPVKDASCRVQREQLISKPLRNTDEDTPSPGQR